LQRHSRQIEPDVDAGDQALCQVELVVLQKRDPALEARILGSRKHALQHAFAGLVGRMGLAREDDLHGTSRIGQQTPKPLRIAQQEIGPFVSCKPAGKSKRQDRGRWQRSASREFRRVLPGIAPTVTCFLSDIVKEKVTEALVDGPEPLSVDYSDS